MPAKIDEYREQIARAKQRNELEGQQLQDAYKRVLENLGLATQFREKEEGMIGEGAARFSTERGKLSKQLEKFNNDANKARTQLSAHRRWAEINRDLVVSNHLNFVRKNYERYVLDLLEKAERDGWKNVIDMILKMARLLGMILDDRPIYPSRVEPPAPAELVERAPELNVDDQNKQLEAIDGERAKLEKQYGEQIEKFNQAFGELRAKETESRGKISGVIGERGGQIAQLEKQRGEIEKALVNNQERAQELQDSEESLEAEYAQKVKEAQEAEEKRAQEEAAKKAGKGRAVRR